MCLSPWRRGKPGRSVRIFCDNTPDHWSRPPSVVPGKDAAAARGVARRILLEHGECCCCSFGADCRARASRGPPGRLTPPRWAQARSAAAPRWLAFAPRLASPGRDRRRRRGAKPRDSGAIARLKPACPWASSRRWFRIARYGPRASVKAEHAARCAGIAGSEQCRVSKSAGGLPRDRSDVGGAAFSSAAACVCMRSAAVMSAEP